MISCKIQCNQRVKYFLCFNSDIFKPYFRFCTLVVGKISHNPNLITLFYNGLNRLNQMKANALVMG